MTTIHHCCVYMNCSNNNRHNKNVSFFKFPVDDVKRAEEWQKKSGNINIASMDVSDLKNRMICEVHFSHKYLRKNRRRKLLTKNAVPIQFIPKDTLPASSGTSKQDPVPRTTSTSATQELAVGEHARNYNRKRRNSDSGLETDNEIKYFNSFTKVTNADSPGSKSSSSRSKLSERILQMESPTKDPLEKKVNTLICQTDKLKKKIRANRSKIYRCKTKTSISSTIFLLTLLIHRSSFVKTFVNMQIYHKKNTRWTKDEQQLALSLYYKSPGTYKFMIHFLGFILPPVKTIHSWLKVFNLEPGIHTALIEKLSLKAKTMEDQEKKIVVMFDEIKLKPQLEYNQVQDKIEGYEDLGSLGQCAKLANTALVFLIRGVFYNWTMPLCYYASSGPVSRECLQKLISEVIKKLKDMTFTPLVLVCDQGSNNRGAMKLLGATKDKPAVEIEGQKIFTCFDVPHLLTSLRNNFMNFELKFLINKMAIAWTDITETYQIDKLNTVAKTMLKITDTHIWPTNFQKMSVKYAAQIFSNTVAAAVQTASRIGQITSSTALTTAQFIRNINNIFDALNSRIVKDPNPHRRPLSVFNNFTVDLLQNGLDYFKSFEIFENNKIRNDIHCINGFQWTINSILQLWNYLKDSGVNYLLTGFLNQDALEFFFSVVRNRGGYNPTPTVKQFRIAMQHNMHMRLQTNVDSGNCEIQEGENLSVYDENTEEENISSTAPPLTSEETNKTVSKDSPTEMLTHSLSLETCSATYVAGYLAYKLEKKYMCDNCASLTKYENTLMNEKELFLLSKDYGRQDTQIKFVKRPSDQFTEIVINLLLEFNKAFDIYKCKRGISYNIENKLKIYLFANYSDWCQTYLQGECNVHMQFMLKLFIKMKLFRNMKWESSIKQKAIKQRESTEKPHRKIRILES